MKLITEYADERRHFVYAYAALVWFGEALLYLFFAAPFAVDQYAAVFSLTMPKQAELFGTVWPYFSVLHLLALLTAMALFCVGSRRNIFGNKPLVVYCIINLIALSALPVLTPTGRPIYWDFGIELLRLSSLAFLANAILAARGYNPLILARALLIVLIVPLILLLATNPTGFLADRKGRVNGPGLEVTSTGHVAAFALILAMSIPIPRRYRVTLITIGAIMLLLSGARIPFILAMMFMVVQVWRRTRSKAKRIALLVGVALFAGLAVLIASTSSIGGGRLGSLTGGSDTIESEYALGRGVAALTALRAIAEHPLGYLDSDWAIQQELVRLGYPSHTHSHYFQSYLRFGPLMIIFWGVLAWRARLGSRFRSPYSPCLWFVLAGSALDYYGFVTKAMLLVFMISEFNEAYLRRAQSRSFASEIRSASPSEKGALA